MVSRNAPVWFGKYKLLERIAVGGMAEVFLAVRPGLEGFEKTFAIKRIRPHLSNEDAFLKMFLFEAKLAAGLQHPHVVQIFDLGKINDSFYIAMEYISGRDMSRVIPKAEKLGITFPIEYAFAIGERVLDGLAYAHTKADDFGEPLNIVHRDITPENVMVGWNGNVKILDFGIAKANSQTDQTKAGEIKGKLSYMSPEQGMGKKLDERSDIFTLGVVLYEWITGYKLFTGENEMAILKSIIDGRIYPPSYFREDIPEGIEAILMKALAKDREERYQTARDMQFDIQQWLHTVAAFTPTNTHLANFMKQIFADEIERERERSAEAAKARRGKTPPPVPATGKHDVMVGEAVGKAKEGSDKSAALIVVDSSIRQENGARHTLELNLSAAEFEKIRVVAQKKGVAPEEVARDLVTTTIKYF
ncbi:MAG: serine/threonine-protein kinase [Deltaproteobacteria bacterium]